MKKSAMIYCEYSKVSLWRRQYQMPLTGYFFFIIFLISCKEKFTPVIKPQQTNYLVVEGFINAGPGITNVQLSRTTLLNDPGLFAGESNALVTIVGENNSENILFENGNGYYSSAPLTLDKNTRYRLHIKTTDGSDYLSDFVSALDTPPIDSINWKMKNDGVQVYANTHDPQNSVEYYKWDYEETWEILSFRESLYKYIPDPFPAMIPRDPAEAQMMLHCWQTQPSSNIIIGSSVALASDVVSLQPVSFVEPASEKLSVRYSILVRQRGLDKEGYEFFNLIKKNTESIGSIFDAQPSDVTGNIHCTNNPQQKVIGYIGAATYQEKRIFISKTELSHWDFDLGCYENYVVNDRDSLQIAFGGNGLIPYQSKTAGIIILGYFGSSSRCIDCRGRGSSVKPSFW